MAMTVVQRKVSKWVDSFRGGQKSVFDAHPGRPCVKVKG
jgi:hypothetical protein